MKIAVEISEDKYKALKKCREAGMELGMEQRAILDGVVLDDLPDNIKAELGERFKEKQISEYMGISDDKRRKQYEVLHK